jgi:Uma2 family endonuclease
MFMGIQFPLAAASSAPSLLRITAEQLEAMAARGAFDRLPRVELREGLLHQMSPQHFPHGIAKTDIFAALLTALAHLNLPLRVLSEVSVRVSEAEVPMPDISLVQSGRYPGPVPVEQVRLAVEISDTTLADDLGRKRTLYALGGIPEYWVVDLSARVIFQHWSPEGDAYAKSVVVPFGDALASATLSGLVILTTGLRDDSNGFPSAE